MNARPLVTPRSASQLFETAAAARKKNALSLGAVAAGGFGFALGSSRVSLTFSQAELLASERERALRTVRLASALPFPHTLRVDPDRQGLMFTRWMTLLERTDTPWEQSLRARTRFTRVGVALMKADNPGIRGQSHDAISPGIHEKN